MKSLLALSAACILLSGCSFTNRSYVKDIVATLPSGDQISAVAELEQQLGKPTQSQTYVLWTRAGKDTRLTELRQVGWIIPHHHNTQTHFAPDGNHVWLTANGSTVASFDYPNSVAIFGDKGQPDWAANLPK